MKHLILIIGLGLALTSVRAQRNWEPYLVTIGIDQGDTTNAYISVGKLGGFGGEFSFGANNNSKGYVGGLITRDLYAGKNKLTKEKGFNIKVGVGIETEEFWAKSNGFNFKEEVKYHAQVKTSIRYKRIETSVRYSSSGVSLGFGVLLKKF